MLAKFKTTLHNLKTHLKFRVTFSLGTIIIIIIIFIIMLLIQKEIILPRSSQATSIQLPPNFLLFCFIVKKFLIYQVSRALSTHSRNEKIYLWLEKRKDENIFFVIQDGITKWWFFFLQKEIKNWINNIAWEKETEPWAICSEHFPSRYIFLPSLSQLSHEQQKK